MNGRAARRRHDRNQFFKFVSFDIARIILTNRTIRWSAPSEFNDIFDIPHELALGFTAEAFNAHFNEEFARLIRNPDSLDVRGNPSLFELLQVVRRGTRKQRRDAAALLRQRGPQVLGDTVARVIEELQTEWRQIVSEMRVLCLTETNTDTVMWGTYGRENTGAVIEFKCLDELDTPLHHARRVEYVEHLPQFTTVEEAVQAVLMGRLVFEPRTVFTSCCYYKTPGWAHEREWRILNFARAGEDNGRFIDLRFSPREVTAIYVGANMADANIEVIRGLLTGDLGEVALFQSVPNRRDRRIEFRRLN